MQSVCCLFGILWLKIETDTNFFWLHTQFLPRQLTAHPPHPRVAPSTTTCFMFPCILEVSCFFFLKKPPALGNSLLSPCKIQMWSGDFLRPSLLFDIFQRDPTAQTLPHSCLAVNKQPHTSWSAHSNVHRSDVFQITKTGSLQNKIRAVQHFDCTSTADSCLHFTSGSQQLEMKPVLQELSAAALHLSARTCKASLKPHKLIFIAVWFLFLYYFLRYKINEERSTNLWFSCGSGGKKIAPAIGVAVPWLLMLMIHSP